MLLKNKSNLQKKIAFYADILRFELRYLGLEAKVLPLDDISI